MEILIRILQTKESTIIVAPVPDQVMKLSFIIFTSLFVVTDTTGTWMSEHAEMLLTDV